MTFKNPSGFLMTKSSVSTVSASNAAAAVFLMRVEAHTIKATKSNPGIKSSICLKVSMSKSVKGKKPRSRRSDFFTFSHFHFFPSLLHRGKLPAGSINIAAAGLTDVCREAA